jgi:MerR family transcriptional regulator, copper efflux regulator
LKISQVAKLSGVSSKTIRYYESISLISVACRDPSGYREYDNSALAQLIFIRRCRDLQIPLEQIKQLIIAQANKAATCVDIDQIIATQLTKVRKTLNELALLEKTLSDLAECCHQDRVSDCKILQRLTTKPTNVPHRVLKNSE